MVYKSFIIIASIVVLSLLAVASELVSFKSHYGVDKSVDRLKEALISNGFTIISEINSTLLAKKGGEKLNKQVTLTVGSVVSDAKILHEDPRAALDIPLRVTLYRDFKGDTWIVYKKPQSYKDIYRLSHCVVLPNLDKRLQKSIKEAIAIKSIKDKVK